MESPEPPPPPPPNPAPPPLCPYGHWQGEGGEDDPPASTPGCIPCDRGWYMSENNHNRKKCEICPEATYAPDLGAAYCLDCVVPACAVRVESCDNKTGSVNEYAYYKEGLPEGYAGPGVETTHVCRNNQAVDPCDRVTCSPASPASPPSPHPRALVPALPFPLISLPPAPPSSSSRSPSTATPSSRRARASTSRSTTFGTTCRLISTRRRRAPRRAQAGRAGARRPTI